MPPTWILKNGKTRQVQILKLALELSQWWALAKFTLVFGAAVLLHQKKFPGEDVILMEEMRSLIEESYWCQLNQLPKQEWAEYFDGPTGTWVGQQSRTYQTWTIVGFLLMNHFLRNENDDLEMLNI